MLPGMAAAVESSSFSFDSAAKTWRVEVPAHALSGASTEVRLAVTGPGAKALLAHGLRLDVEACLVPQPGHHEGAAPFPAYLVASLNPHNPDAPATSSWGGGGGSSSCGATEVAFTVSWDATAASLASPQVVLFVAARPVGAFVTKPLTRGNLDAAALIYQSAPQSPTHAYHPRGYHRHYGSGGAATTPLRHAQLPPCEGEAADSPMAEAASQAAPPRLRRVPRFGGF
jgi:hypothetical protein